MWAATSENSPSTLSNDGKGSMTSNHKNFGHDLAHIQKNVEAIVLENSADQKIVVVPDWQGRTMTSTAQGDQGFSYGWVNYDRIESGKVEPQINLFGGEDRFWISPEGSQFSFFFPPGAKMELGQWRTPDELDMQPFELVDHQPRLVRFRKAMCLTNFAGHDFEMLIERTVKINSDKETERHLGMKIPDGVFSVSHESHNEITNDGSQAWHPERGLPAAWMLCMNKPSDSATVMVPFRPGDLEERGKIVTADYFGRLDSKRLRICEDSNLIYFVGDGKLRSKLGVSFQRAVNYLGAWDAQHGCLTIVQFNLPDQVDVGYTNNLWKHVDDPYQGDVINSYNDGPNEHGEMMGPFYELETLSPALNLQPGDSYTHIHRTLHLEGDRDGLDSVCEHVFGVNTAKIEQVF